MPDVGQLVYESVNCKDYYNMKLTVDGVLQVYRCERNENWIVKNSVLIWTSSLPALIVRAYSYCQDVMVLLANGEVWNVKFDKYHIEPLTTHIPTPPLVHVVHYGTFAGCWYGLTTSGEIRFITGKVEADQPLPTPKGRVMRVVGVEQGAFAVLLEDLSVEMWFEDKYRHLQGPYYGLQTPDVRGDVTWLGMITNDDFLVWVNPGDM